MGTDMFDNESSEAKRPTDWSGTIIGLMLLPVFFVFAFLGKAELGFNVMLVSGLVMIAVRLRWRLRKYAWFWATIVLVFLVHWPESRVPTIAYSLPLGVADFLLISGALGLAEKLFSKGSSLDWDDQ